MATEPSDPKIAFFGLGAMGRPMAIRLVDAGLPLTVYDVRSDEIAALADRGAIPCGSPADALARADIVCVMVATPEQVDDVLFGHDALMQLPAGALVCVMATVGPDFMRSLQARLATHRIGVLDAPVSGGVARAETGELVIMAGGPEDSFARMRPILKAMGSTVVHCGHQVGDGQAVKLVNQLLAGVHIAVTAEALAYAAALGLDPAAVLEVVGEGAAGSFMLQDRGRRMLTREFTPARSALDIFVKDMGLVVDAAGERRFPCPISAVVRQLFLMGTSSGWGREDDSGILRVYESWVGEPATTA